MAMTTSGYISKLSRYVQNIGLEQHHGTSVAACRTSSLLKGQGILKNVDGDDIDSRDVEGYLKRNGLSYTQALEFAETRILILPAFSSSSSLSTAQSSPLKCITAGNKSSKASRGAQVKWYLRQSPNHDASADRRMICNIPFVWHWTAMEVQSGERKRDSNIPFVWHWPATGQEAGPPLVSACRREVAVFAHPNASFSRHSHKLADRLSVLLDETEPPYDSQQCAIPPMQSRLDHSVVELRAGQDSQDSLASFCVVNVASAPRSDCKSYSSVLSFSACKRLPCDLASVCSSRTLRTFCQENRSSITRFGDKPNFYAATFLVLCLGAGLIPDHIPHIPSKFHRRRGHILLSDLARGSTLSKYPFTLLSAKDKPLDRQLNNSDMLAFERAATAPRLAMPPSSLHFLCTFFLPCSTINTNKQYGSRPEHEEVKLSQPFVNTFEAGSLRKAISSLICANRDRLTHPSESQNGQHRVLKLHLGLCYTFSENQFVQFSKPPLEKRNSGQPLLATERRVLTTAPSFQGSSGLWVQSQPTLSSRHAALSANETSILRNCKGLMRASILNSWSGTNFLSGRTDEGLFQDLHGKEKVTYEAESHENGMTGGVQRRPKRRKSKDRTLAAWVLDEKALWKWRTWEQGRIKTRGEDNQKLVGKFAIQQAICSYSCSRTCIDPRVVPDSGQHPRHLHTRVKRQPQSTPIAPPHHRMNRIASPHMTSNCPARVHYIPAPTASTSWRRASASPQGTVQDEHGHGHEGEYANGIMASDQWSAESVSHADRPTSTSSKAASHALFAPTYIAVKLGAGAFSESTRQQDCEIAKDATPGGGVVLEQCRSIFCTQKILPNHQRTSSLSACDGSQPVIAATKWTKAHYSNRRWRPVLAQEDAYRSPSQASTANAGNGDIESNEEGKSGEEAERSGEADSDAEAESIETADRNKTAKSSKAAQNNEPAQSDEKAAVRPIPRPMAHRGHYTTVGATRRAHLTVPLPQEWQQNPNTKTAKAETMTKAEDKVTNQEAQAREEQVIFSSSELAQHKLVSLDHVFGDWKVDVETRDANPQNTENGKELAAALREHELDGGLPVVRTGGGEKAVKWEDISFGDLFPLDGSAQQGDDPAFGSYIPCMYTSSRRMIHNNHKAAIAPRHACADPHAPTSSNEVVSDFPSRSVHLVQHQIQQHGKFLQSILTGTRICPKSRSDQAPTKDSRRCMRLGGTASGECCLSFKVCPAQIKWSSSPRTYFDREFIEERIIDIRQYNEPTLQARRDYQQTLYTAGFSVKTHRSQYDTARHELSNWMVFGELGIAATLKAHMMLGEWPNARTAKEWRKDKMDQQGGHDTPPPPKIVKRPPTRLVRCSPPIPHPQHQATTLVSYQPGILLSTHSTLVRHSDMRGKDLAGDRQGQHSRAAAFLVSAQQATKSQYVAALKNVKCFLTTLCPRLRQSCSMGCRYIAHEDPLIPSGVEVSELHRTTACFPIASNNWRMRCVTSGDKVLEPCEDGDMILGEIDEVASLGWAHTHIAHLEQFFSIWDTFLATAQSSPVFALERTRLATSAAMRQGISSQELPRHLSICSSSAIAATSPAERASIFELKMTCIATSAADAIRRVIARITIPSFEGSPSTKAATSPAERAKSVQKLHIMAMIQGWNCEDSGHTGCDCSCLMPHADQLQHHVSKRCKKPATEQGATGDAASSFDGDIPMLQYAMTPSVHIEGQVSNKPQSLRGSGLGECNLISHKNGNLREELAMLLARPIVTPPCCRMRWQMGSRSQSSRETGLGEHLPISYEYSEDEALIEPNQDTLNGLDSNQSTFFRKLAKSNLRGVWQA
ncbi:uncharacterized protein MYCFIDRAFT_180691 [Pseudocercospora fijiensis CIRAD86]|uniref:Uncharacterized protein n=1 Tax=Pseudocercospora fijiensis (strain CIRAD86) TaxID=383855 RepID=M3AHW5_PSEFD|nr:uncharacterized protein MYCFIDRAFT_180691 [Pseudocercospora fijiensis CIRAD86]EME76788.1 hypothetical protein MYCFIDRAFT_180691 [Pseudocercospora fijiensis CIRAD86]